MNTLLGFDVSKVPTADLMELAARLLEVDQGTIDGLRGCLNMLGADMPVPEQGTTRSMVALLRERAKAVRALEAATVRAELDS